MKPAIVVTSIFQPTEAIEKFSKYSDFQLIVVGDKKSPAEWRYDNVEYLSVEEQSKLNFGLAKVLPYNHYCRKMLGYLWAIKNRHDCIIDTDDDNIPKKDWNFPPIYGQFDTVVQPKGFINIYQLFTKKKIWPRGLPLRLINTDFNLDGSLVVKQHPQIGIWQGLADEDPDVDAVYRLTTDEPCNFEKRPPVVLDAGVISPFNSQNTLITKDLFTLLYLPTYVTFRFTDILRGLVAQPIMWLYGYRLGFTGATVVQKRNPHDYTKDFVSELPMYLHCETVLNLVENAISSTKSMGANLLSAYEALLEADIVTSEEIITLKAWLSDLEDLETAKTDLK
ncbi:MAG: hypothetical protein K0S09_3151 [Sphingobacteriaceae bacterium]|jgi:hypothetical protein|nr:hypothetical protein [Sphingobacteriaceae bacterium]